MTFRRKLDRRNERERERERREKKKRDVLIMPKCSTSLPMYITDINSTAQHLNIENKKEFPTHGLIIYTVEGKYLQT
jgi:hypothetical protein